jgi:hypothetical protein
MLTASDVYERYQVPPWLRIHQVRVAAVAQFLAERTPGSNAELVVSTCLLHDVGAIVKFDFEYMRREMPDLCPADEIPHWEDVQAVMRTRYGEHEHAASEAIIRELGRNDVVVLFNTMGFAHMREILDADTPDALIAQYADMRVGPTGVLPLSLRMEDAGRRYGYAFVESYAEDAREVERKIFEKMPESPEDITDAHVEPLIQELWEYGIA